MLRLIKQVFISLLSFAYFVIISHKTYTAKQYFCVARSNFIDLNSNEVRYQRFEVSLHKCNGSCNTPNDPSGGRCVAIKTKTVNLYVFNKIATINESKALRKHSSCNSNQKWNKKECL